ncbi:MAG: ABC transporter substrate-binding protein [Chromatiales bacterium]
MSTGASSLDPRFATDATSERINHLLYARLIDFDERQMPVPGIATWRLINESEYEFQLKEDRARFTDDSPVTSVDVVASFQFVLNPANLSPHRESIALIKSVTAIDEQRIRFAIDQPDPLFPAYLDIAILPAKLIQADHDFNQQPVGSGPFEFVEKNAEQRLLLKRRRDGQLVEFLQVKDPTVRVLKLLNQEVDLLQNDLSPELYRYLTDQPQISALHSRGSNFTYLGFNLQDENTGDLRIRQAIAHAINREEIIHHVFNNAAAPAESILRPTHWAASDDLPILQFDPPRARQLLKQAGFDQEKPLEISYKTSSDPFRIKLATIIQHQLKQVGIRMHIKSYDWGTFFGDIKAGRFQMYSLSWVGIKTPDIYRYVFHSQATPPKGANRGRYSSQRVDELLQQVKSSGSLEQQAKLYRAIQQQLHEDLPYVPLWYEDQHVFMHKRLHNYRPREDGRYDGLESITH